MTGRKRWFRVADKVGHKPWSNDQLAALIRLWAHMNTRWARDEIPHAEAGYCELINTDLMRITGKHRADVALKSARSLADVSEISVRHQNDITVIDWPNFPIFQEYGSRLRNRSRPLQDEDEEGEKRKSVPSGTHTQENLELVLPPPGDLEKLLPLLKSPEGQEDEKRAWLEEELPVIDADVHAGKGKYPQLVIRYYRQYLKGERRWKGIDELRAQEAMVDEIEKQNALLPKPEPIDLELLR